MSGSPWLIIYDSLPSIPPEQRRKKQLLIHATSSSDAWDQARMRLGDTSCVLSVKPLMEDLS